MYDTYVHTYVRMYVCIIMGPDSYNMPVSVELTDLTSLHFVCKGAGGVVCTPASPSQSYTWAVWCGVL